MVGTRRVGEREEENRAHRKEYATKRGVVERQAADEILKSMGGTRLRDQSWWALREYLSHRAG